MKHRIIYLFVLLSAFSCKKDDDKKAPIKLKIEGYVREKQTGKPHSRAKVWITKSSGGEFFKGGYSDMGTYTTDSNGYYTTDFEVEYGASLSLWWDVDTGDYFYLPSQNLTVWDNYYRIDLDIFLKGYIKFNFINSKPTDSTYLFFKPIVANWNSTMTGYSNGFFTTFNKTVHTEAGDKIPLYYFVRRNGIESEFYDTVKIPVKDTLVYTKVF